MKKRLDVVLVERGLAESRAQAQALVIAGLVHGYDKPGHQVDEAVELTVDRPPRWVSRGGEKLAHGLDRLGVDPAGLDCVDVGASTGGFTDVLLERGAARVIAIDVDGNAHRTLLMIRKFSPCLVSSPAGLPYFWISTVRSVSKSCAPAVGAEVARPKYDHNRTMVIFSLPAFAPA